MTESGVPTRVTIIIPALNEACSIERTLTGLQRFRSDACQVLLVDGGSHDNTAALAEPLVDRVLRSDCGRARQMNVGAAKASGNWFLFLHADTQLPLDFPRWLQQLGQQSGVWGFFPVRLSGSQRLLRMIEAAMNYRSRLTGVATGDQGLLVRADVFHQLGGFPNMPLMEDVAMTKKLRLSGRPFLWPSPVLTSSRRWEQRGILKTMLLMWGLRLAFFLGVNPQQLSRAYSTPKS